MNARRTVFQILNGLFVSLFLLAAAVQYNDPDPFRWMAIYLAAAVAGVLPSGHFSSRAVPVATLLIALVWLIYLAPALAEVPLSRLFDQVEMKSPQVEEARECVGLMIVVGWMTALLARLRAKKR